MNNPLDIESIQEHVLIGHENIPSSDIHHDVATMKDDGTPQFPTGVDLHPPL